ncbi:hypothetical protein Q0590_00130 [Rhodocytophaga aerolata]|uniref:Uncharacterized protein n=1 Tax=Rhodocytophaga aerolata TaxID=455078 RepID=A0ABT8QXR4_9BACT|nr:hypothetical protein [Rhodocytophaga aerolata]MDO1444631.1 hypothetical protein [Rhodocytophaga aerolata]
MKMYRLEVLEEQLVATPLGRQIRDIFEEHVEEVMMLINHNRQVMVIWHRNLGPEFINHAVRSGMEKDFEVPREIKGIQLTTLLRRMAAVLQENGSPALARTIGNYSVLVLNWAQRCNSLHQVFDEIKKINAEFTPGTK